MALVPIRPVAGTAAEDEDVRLAEARAALARREYVAAFRACRAARSRGAPLPAVLSLEAEIFKQTAYLDREIETLRRWTAAAPADARPWLMLFYIYQDLGWRREAGEAAGRAARCAPQDPHTLIARALSDSRSREQSFGLPLIEEALRRDPANLELENLRATVLLKAARYAEAERVLRGALARDPRNARDRLALAQALERQGRLEEAAASLRAAQKEKPDDPEAAYELGALAEKQGDLAEAARQLERAAAANAQFSKVLWHLGRVCMRQGRAEEGRRLLRMYRKMDANTSAYETVLAQLERRPDDPALHHRLARFHLDADELPQAIVELRRVIEKRGGSEPLLRAQGAAARRELAAALMRQGRLTEARQLGTRQPPP